MESIVVEVCTVRLQRLLGFYMDYFCSVIELFFFLIIVHLVEERFVNMYLCYRLSQTCPWFSEEDESVAQIFGIFLAYTQGLILPGVPWLLPAFSRRYEWRFPISFVCLSGHSRFAVATQLWRRSGNANRTFSSECFCLTVC